MTRTKKDINDKWDQIKFIKKNFCKQTHKQSKKDKLQPGEKSLQKTDLEHWAKNINSPELQKEKEMPKAPNPTEGGSSSAMRCKSQLPSQLKVALGKLLLPEFQGITPCKGNLAFFYYNITEASLPPSPQPTSKNSSKETPANTGPGTDWSHLSLETMNGTGGRRHALEKSSGGLQISSSTSRGCLCLRRGRGGSKDVLLLFLQRNNRRMDKPIKTITCRVEKDRGESTGDAPCSLFCLWNHENISCNLRSTIKPKRK